MTGKQDGEGSVKTCGLRDMSALRAFLESGRGMPQEAASYFARAAGELLPGAGSMECLAAAAGDRILAALVPGAFDARFDDGNGASFLALMAYAENAAVDAELLLEEAGRRAAGAGKTFLRLVLPGGAEELVPYYTRIGFFAAGRSFRERGDALLLERPADPVQAKAARFAAEKFAGDAGGHDMAHTLRVYRLAGRICAAEGGDPAITGLAALLHDMDDRKLSPETAGTLGHARHFLEEHGIREETAERILTVIREVSFAGTDTKVPSTLEGKCVQDADRLDAIGALGIARTFAYGGSHARPIFDPAERPALGMDGETYRNRKSSSISHFYEKLLLLDGMMNTKTGKEISAHRHRVLLDFLDEFAAEWSGMR